MFPWHPLFPSPHLILHSTLSTSSSITICSIHNPRPNGLNQFLWSSSQKLQQNFGISLTQYMMIFILIPMLRNYSEKVFFFIFHISGCCKTRKIYMHSKNTGVHSPQQYWIWTKLFQAFFFGHEDMYGAKWASSVFQTKAAVRICKVAQVNIAKNKLESLCAWIWIKFWSLAVEEFLNHILSSNFIQDPGFKKLCPTK